MRGRKRKEELKDVLQPITLEAALGGGGGAKGRDAEET